GHEDRGALAQAETPLEGELTAVAGGVRVADVAANLGDSLHEGDVLETDANSALHARLAPGTGFVLAADSRLELSRVRPSGVVLSLERGSVSSAVRTGDVYRVEAGSYRVVVRGTRFSVSRVGDGVQVSLAEGTVAIERGDATLEVLHAPARWRSPDVAESASVDAPVETPIALDARLPWPSLTLPPFPRVVAWEVEGARFDAERSVALRAPQGELRLRAFDARGRAREVTLQLAPEGLTLSEAMLPRQRLPQARGQLSPDAIRSVVRARQPALRRCYERVLRRLGDPSLTRAAYSLRVDVGARGDVRRVRLTASGGEPHAALRDCITHEVRGWTFPAPQGGPVSFELPLNLSAR
ncbi:MAG: FecR domain-containing protein, partial [Deltaproteobacteria bacterium]|nr:FecR domain-containing protein [Deltaproteobacteria bacterium]